MCGDTGNGAMSQAKKKDVSSVDIKHSILKKPIAADGLLKGTAGRLKWPSTFRPRGSKITLDRGAER